MKTLFNLWSELKYRLHIQGLDRKDPKGFFIKPREVWYIHMWQNIGFEQSGKWSDFKRPVLILKKLGSVFLCISLTTKGKDNDFYIPLSDSIFERSSFIITSQPKIIDKRRCIEKIWIIPKNEFNIIKKKLQNFWF